MTILKRCTGWSSRASYSFPFYVQTFQRRYTLNLARFQVPKHPSEPIVCIKRLRKVEREPKKLMRYILLTLFSFENSHFWDGNKWTTMCDLQEEAPQHHHQQQHHVDDQQQQQQHMMQHAMERSMSMGTPQRSPMVDSMPLSLPRKSPGLVVEQLENVSIPVSVGNIYCDSTSPAAASSNHHQNNSSPQDLKFANNSGGGVTSEMIQTYTTGGYTTLYAPNSNSCNNNNSSNSSGNSNHEQSQQQQQQQHHWCLTDGGILATAAVKAELDHSTYLPVFTNNPGSVGGVDSGHVSSNETAMYSSWIGMGNGSPPHTLMVENSKMQQPTSSSSHGKSNGLRLSAQLFLP